MLLAAMVILVGGVVAACGGDDDSAAPAPAEEPAPEPAPADPPADPPAEPPAEEPAPEPPAEPPAVPAPSGDAAAGSDLYANAGCGNCHTLADAGTTGNIGPNLDDSQPSFERSVLILTSGSGPMPSFLDQLGEDGINDVAAYVVSVTS